MADIIVRKSLSPMLLYSLSSTSDSFRSPRKPGAQSVLAYKPYCTFAVFVYLRPTSKQVSQPIPSFDYVAPFRRKETEYSHNRLL